MYNPNVGMLRENASYLQQSNYGGDGNSEVYRASPVYSPKRDMSAHLDPMLADSRYVNSNPLKRHGSKSPSPNEYLAQQPKGSFAGSMAKQQEQEQQAMRDEIRMLNHRLDALDS